MEQSLIDRAIYFTPPVVATVGSALTLTKAACTLTTAPYLVTAGALVGVAVAFFIEYSSSSILGCPCCNRPLHAAATGATALLFGIAFPLNIFSFYSVSSSLMNGLNCSVTLLSSWKLYQIYTGKQFPGIVPDSFDKFSRELLSKVF